jgi:hypothetical protein
LAQSRTGVSRGGHRLSRVLEKVRSRISVGTAADSFGERTKGRGRCR